MARVLSTAEERRETVLEAAETVFTERGIHGTPTTAVAKAAGISHAYLFRLFPTKEDLVVAVVRRCHERIAAAFTAAAAGARERGEEVLSAMGMAYVELLQDRELLLLQLHAHAAATSIEAVRDVDREGFGRLVELVQRESGASGEEIQRFFAIGMLLNVLGAMDAPALDEPWVQVLLGPYDDKTC